MPFTIPNFLVKLMSSFENGYNISKIGECESHCLVTNELRKENSHKNRFSLISERTPTRLWKFRQICESPKRHWVSVSSDFSFAALDPGAGTNFFFWGGGLCAGRLSLWLPRIPGCVGYPILESFFGSPLSALSGRAIIFPWLEQGMTPPVTCVKLLQFLGWPVHSVFVDNNLALFHLW